MDENEIIYVGDPMCSWCWGIEPELERLQQRLPGTGFKVVTGGLRPGPDAQMISDELVGYLRGEWERIALRTGQAFDYGLLERRDWLYDTEPACRAVVVMREMDESLAWPMFRRLQRAFYAEGVVISEPDNLPELAAEAGADPGEFAERFASRQMEAAVWADFGQALQWGATAFPTVFARMGTVGYVVTSGYTTAETMLSRLPDGFAAVSGTGG